MTDDALPDALASVLGRVVADARMDFRKEIDRASAEMRATIAGLEAHNAELRSENADLQRALKDSVDVELARVRDVLATVKNGEPGPRGDPGEPGPAPDPELIARMVSDEVAKIPPAQPGEPGPPGKDGSDGRDVDPQVLEATIVAHVAKAISELPKPRDGIDGTPGENGEPGAPGEPGPQGERGEPGQDGAPGLDGKDADPEFVAALVSEKVATAIAALPPPEKGENGAPGERGEKGEPGERGEAGLAGRDGQPGEKGEKGDPGVPGRDGAGVAGALIDRSGALVLTLSDGTVRELGLVVGRDGEKGLPGTDGRDGKDGLSFADFDLEPEYDGERTLRLKWTNGSKEHVREWRLPVVIDRGVYKAGQSYLRADAVSFGGSLWIAQEDTSEKPGNGGAAWRLAVKHGRDGRDGEKGPKGDKGDPGRPGVDFVRPKT